MIQRIIWMGETANEEGRIELYREFFGKIEELSVDYGSLGLETKITIVTSNGRKLVFEGNDNALFPVSPRRSLSEEKYFQSVLGADNAGGLEKYLNAGVLSVIIENADDGKVLKKLEVIYSDS